MIGAKKTKNSLSFSSIANNKKQRINREIDALFVCEAKRKGLDLVLRVTLKRLELLSIGACCFLVVDTVEGFFPIGIERKGGCVGIGVVYKSEGSGIAVLKIRESEGGFAKESLDTLDFLAA